MRGENFDTENNKMNKEKICKRFKTYFKMHDCD